MVVSELADLIAELNPNGRRLLSTTDIDLEDGGGLGRLQGNDDGDDDDESAPRPSRVSIVHDDHESIVDRVLSFVGLTRVSHVHDASRHSTADTGELSAAHRTKRMSGVAVVPTATGGPSLSFGRAKAKDQHKHHHHHADRVKIKWKFEAPPPPAPESDKNTKVDPKSKTQFFHVFGGW